MAPLSLHRLRAAALAAVAIHVLDCFAPLATTADFKLWRDA